jgi:ketosteroid isomerase-like protein
MSMSTSNKPIIERLLRTIDANDLDGVKKLFSPDIELVTPNGVFRGSEQAAAWLKPFLDAFSELKHTMIGFVETGNEVAFEIKITGKNTRPMASPQGPIPPTNKSIDLRSASFIRLQNEKVAGYRIYFDQAEFVAQLGLK